MLKSKISNITEQIEKIKKSIIEEINNFEQNPKIKPINKNCFTINMKDLSKDLNLSPFYYNYKLQYEYIGKVIENTKIECILTVLMNIVKYGTHTKDRYETKRFNPIVIQKISDLI